MNKVRLIVTGCGAIAEKAHLPALRRIPQAEISALVDANLGRAQELARKFHLKDALISNDHLNALEKVDCDAGLILTPPSTHARLIEDFASMKKHIFCEKPIAINLADARNIVKSLPEGIKFMIGFSNRFLPQINKMHQLVKSGEIGRPFAMISLFSQDIFQWPTVSAYQFKKEQGGGALFDSGAHYADLFRWFLGDVKSVESKTASLNKKTSSIDDFATVQFDFINGATGTLYVIWSGPMLNEFLVMGDKGILKADGLSNNVQVFKKEFWVLAPVEIKAEKVLSPYHSELLHFIDCIRKNREVDIGAKEGIESLRIILAAYKSAETGQKVFMKAFEG